MSRRFALSRDEIDLAGCVETLLGDPAQRDNPMRATLETLFGRYEEQRVRLERLVRISDGYHNVARSRNLSLIDEYDKQIHRLGKLARISDRYQNHLREVNEKLKEVALRDPLTGMGNRRFLMERLKEESERAQRTENGFALAILDVDHFKSINDRFGHEAGDRALCHIAHAIQSAVRDYDVTGRWGGEEFLVMLPDTQLDVAQRVCERVRAAIEAAPMGRGDAAGLRLSASLGLTAQTPGEHFSETLKRADAALLRAKAAGRNRSEIA